MGATVGFFTGLALGYNKKVGYWLNPVTKFIAVIDIDLPRPRARAQDTFQVYRSKILDILNLGGDIGTIEYQI